MALGQKEWHVVYKDHKIRVVNTWLSGAKLYIDGDCRDTNSDLFSVTSTSPLLSASLPSKEIVEVYLVSVVVTKAKICVDGQQIGGDSLD